LANLVMGTREQFVGTPTQLVKKVQKAPNGPSDG
jgi:hypothetical protein